mgnify:CR=1 FL=1
MNKPPASLIDHLFEHAGSGLGLLDAAGRVRRANPLWLSALSVGRDEVIDRELWALFPDAGGELRALVAEALRSGAPRPVPARLLRRGDDAPGHEGELTPVALGGERICRPGRLDARQPPRDNTKTTVGAERTRHPHRCHRGQECRGPRGRKHRHAPGRDRRGADGRHPHNTQRTAPADAGDRCP